jgi:broad specificity phosphatase PhoE
MGVSVPSQTGNEHVPGRLLVVRHAATEWSTSGRHTGRTDLPLTSEGEDNATSLGRRLAGVEFAIVLSSPLRRALDTCRRAGFAEDVEVTDLLLEMDYGDYEGLTTAEIRATRPNWDLFRDGCPGGETIEDVSRRADLLIERLTADATLRGADVLAFGHGHMIRVLTARWLGCEAAGARSFALEALGIGVLSWEHEWPTLRAWNV